MMFHHEHLIRLHEILAKRFDAEELRTLCFGLNLDYDDLKGEGKYSKARELVTFLDRRGRIAELIVIGKDLRPDAAWAADDAALPSPTSRPRLERLPPVVSSVAGFYVPYSFNRLSFVGRDQELELLATMFRAPIPIAITGFGGVGKTQLAVAFAHLLQSQFPGGIFWLDMSGSNDIDRQIVKYAGPGGLDLPGYADWTMEECREAVYKIWQQSEPRLLIFDNLEDPELLEQRQPSGDGCRILITARNADWPAHMGVETLPLQPLSRQDSRHLLLRRYGKGGNAFPDDPAIDQICETLGDLPLALTLAGYYLESYPSQTLARYLERITINALNPLFKIGDELERMREVDLPTKHELNLITTFRHEPNLIRTFGVSYEALGGDLPRDVLARSFFHIAAQCAAAPIPRQLLCQAANLDIHAEEDQQRADEALRQLTALGLIQKLKDDQFIVHTLLAAYGRSVSPNSTYDQTQLQAALIAYLATTDVVALFYNSIPYLDHARHLVRVRSQLHLSLTDADRTQYVELCQQLTEQLFHLGQLDAAEEACDAGLRGLSALPYVRHKHVVLLQRSAAIAGERGLYDQAIPKLKQCLKLLHNIADPLLKARIRNNLALCYMETGQRSAARKQLEAIPDLTDQLEAADEPLRKELAHIIITMWNNLGILEQHAHPQEALILFKRCLDLSEMMHDLAAIPRAIGNIGSVAQAQGQWELAHEQFLEADKRYEALGNRQQRAFCRYRLGEVALNQAVPDPQAALNYGTEALIEAQASGASVYESCALRVIGSAHMVLGDLEQAAAALDRAKQLQDHINDPYDQAFIYAALAQLASQRNDWESANTCLQEALKRARKEKLHHLINELRVLEPTILAGLRSHIA